MTNIHDKDWFEIKEITENLFIIRERLDEIDPRFYTKYVNIFLIVGEKKAALIDTGCGLFKLNPIVMKLIDGKDLIVINTHSHFDHRGSNDEFNEIYIHENEVRMACLPLDISFIKDSSKNVVKRYEKKDFKLLPPSKINPIREGVEFDLGNISLKVIHTPGHSPGSISLLSNRNELFTGDTAHYGAIYLPKKRDFPIILNSLSKLLDLCINNSEVELYPSHEDYKVKQDLLEKLIEGINNIENIWESRKKDKFLRSWILKDENFTYII